MLTLGPMEVFAVKESRCAAAEVRPPDLRAVHGPLGLTVRRWSPELRWAELHSRALAFDESFLGPEGLAVFELWDEPARWVARPVGDASLEDSLAVRRLTGWASDRALELGRALPDRAPAPPPVEVPRRFALGPPAFRFVQDSGCDAVRIHPWGRGAELLVDELREPWKGALGDIVVLDADRCEARFARVPDSLRPSAECLLRRWATEDEWELDFREGVEPLIAPRRAYPAHPGESVCTGCGSRLGCGFASALLFHQQGFHRTRCRICWGRRVWFDQGGGAQKHDLGEGDL